MRRREFVLSILAAILLASCEGLETTSIEAPASLPPGGCFQMTMNVIALESSAVNLHGDLAILIPEIWSIDSVLADGYGYQGLMEYWGTGDVFGCTPSIGYVWHFFETPKGVYVSAEPGDTGQAFATIHISDSAGVFQIASLAGVWGSIGEQQWETYPCSCVVEVTPSILEMDTWAGVKVNLGSR